MPTVSGAALGLADFFGSAGAAGFSTGATDELAATGILSGCKGAAAALDKEAELLAIAERLNQKEVGLQSLDKPWADTLTPSGRMVLTVFAGMAEFERALIRQRTQDGLVDARKRGVAFGRPRKLRRDQQELALELIKQGKSVSAVAKTFNVHPATIYRCLETRQGN